MRGIRCALIAAMLGTMVQSEAHAATSWLGNGSYCAGSTYTTCFSVDLSWDYNDGDAFATLTMLNGGSEGDLIKSAGLFNLNLSGLTWSERSGSQDGYDAPPPADLSNIEGIYPSGAYLVSNDQAKMPADLASGTWIFSFGEFLDALDFDNFMQGAVVGAHFISGPNGCSTKPVILADGSYNTPTAESEALCSESVVPEPASMALLATGLVGLGGAGLIRRRRQNG